MNTSEKDPPGQGKIEFILIIGALAFAVLALIGLINEEWRGYVQNWLLKW